MKGIRILAPVFLIGALTSCKTAGDLEDIYFSENGKVVMLSATSSVKNHDVTKAFDGNTASYWSSGDNSLGEGIMIRFERPLDLQNLEIDAICEEDIGFEIYINGEWKREMSPNVQKTFYNTDASTIFIKVSGETDGEVKISEIYVNLGEEAVDGKDDDVFKMLEVVDGRVSASSVLDPETSYAAELLFDNRLDFAWTEGVAGQGIGETITVEFDSEQTFNEIYIANGYQRSESHFDANSRVKEMSVDLDGEYFGTIYMEDDYGVLQKVSLGEYVTAKTVTFTILSVYEGDKYEDTVISEMKFASQGRVIDVATGFMDELSDIYAAKIDGSLLEEMVGEQMLFTESDLDVYTEIELKLRENGSFVAYVTEEVDDSESQTVYEGNWMINSAGDDSAEIKIYGKMRETTESTYWVENEYDGPYGRTYYEEERQTVSSTADAEIFSDVLNISRIGIEGYRDLTLATSVNGVEAEATDLKSDSIEGPVKQDFESAKGSSDAEKEEVQENEDLYLIEGEEIYGLFPGDVIY